MCSESLWFLLDFTQNNVFVCFRLRYAVFPVFPLIDKIHCFQLYCTKNMFLLCLPSNWAVSSVIAPEKGCLPVCSESLWFLLDFTQNNVFVCFRLRYAVFPVFPLIDKIHCFQLYCTKNMFLLCLPSNWALSSVIAPVNGFLFQFMRMTLNFTWEHSKQRFSLFYLGYPVISIILLRATIFSVM